MAPAPRPASKSTIASTRNRIGAFAPKSAAASREAPSSRAAGGLRRARSGAPLPADPRATPGRIPREERVVVGELDAVGTASQGSPVPAPRTGEARVAEIFEELRRVGPGEHLPLLASLRQHDRGLVLQSLRAEFPGLLWFHRHVSHRRLPQGRAAGPLAALLCELGEEALGVVVTLLDEGHADQRYYAALVVADLADRLSAEAQATLVPVLEARIFDADTQVRDVALHALRALERSRPLDDVGGKLAERARDSQANVGARLMALTALGVLRHTPAVPVLIELLRDAAPEVRRGARLALRSITVTDRGRWRWRWRIWARKHLAQGRTQWLLAGLTGGEPALRRVAHADLVRLTGHEVPFDPEGPSDARARVQREYAALLEKAGATPEVG